MNLIQDWIADIKSNGNEALDLIYKKHRNPCVAWLEKNFNLSSAEAVDIFQDSVVICYENVKTSRVQHMDSSLKSYLYGIARNKALENQRKTNRRNLGEQSFSITHTTDSFSFHHINEEKFETLQSLIYQLGDPCKTLLDLFYYHRLNLDLIKEKMNYSSTNTVKTKKYKCIKRLRSSFYNIS